MVANQNSASDVNEEKYARLWFAGLVKFHNLKDAANWEFDEKHVISFLRAKLAAKMPIWKRFKIVEGLIWYRNNVRHSRTPRLEPIRSKLHEMMIEEKFIDNELPIEDVVGKIDPREPDVIQALRRTMRLRQNAFNTEKA